jgi:hypothetical protein
MKKIAVYINGGVVEEIRSNIGKDIEIEVIDNDTYQMNQVFENVKDFKNITDWKKAEDRWKEIKKELQFVNY